VVHQKLSIPLRRKEKVTKMGEPIISLEQKKKGQHGKDGEAKVKHHANGHSSLAYTCT
jgi:hypothetical protein